MDLGTRIAVVGAGLGGLTLAGLLQEQGFTVTLYEQSDAFSRIGAGIILSANPVKVLQRLGLEAGLVARGIKPDAYVSRQWDSGETLYEILFDEASEERYGAPYLNVHRADLHDVLQQPLQPGTLRFAHQLEGIEDRGETLLLRFANGATAEADIVIGADGIRSRVRETILGSEEPRYTGRIAPRAVFPSAQMDRLAIRDCTKWWGPDRHILTYYMTKRRDEVYVMGATPAPGWDVEQGVVEGSRDDFLETFGHFHADLVSVIEKASNVTIWPICDRPRNDRWSDRRIALLGDACHAMRPYMAAGGAMAIEDAAILTRCIARYGDPKSAFGAYEATRIQRVGEVQRISIENSWMHGPTDVDWFFCYDPCTAELADPATARPA
ncbi:FAD-dependent monooxygenase [Amorphus coralli]|uniref:FAD-dependent monooxygenase n=1 Tax=Amorphus coralli TaxID=340680 RepID=UPI00037D6328|nr:FAD-dependent monooxygenase [Amorphus coralli]